MTHLMVFMEVCRVDDRTIVFVADPTFGGQEDLMSKVDSTVEAFDDTLSLGVTQTSIEQCQNHVEERSLESFKRRKLSESTLSLDNPCQVHLRILSCTRCYSSYYHLSV
ncbi:hypothetical protein GIB67_012635, partial [Kingdonia uniflora]